MCVDMLKSCGAWGVGLGEQREQEQSGADVSDDSTYTSGPQDRDHHAVHATWASAYALSALNA